MGKRNILIIFALMLWSLGYAQINASKVKIYIGNYSCDKQPELTRIELLKAGRFTFVVNEIDTVKTVSYTMQMLKGENLSEKFVSKSPGFTPKMKSFFEYNKYEAKTKKIWVEKIKLFYKGDSLLLPSFTIVVKE